MKNEPTSIRPAGTSSQKLKLFIRANAMSGAPICSGIIQFAKPTNAGMIAPNTMIRPCIVVNWLNSSGLTSCSPGWNSSARIARASTPPTISMVNENSRYSVPMSLWLVAYTQRRHPAGEWWWSSWAWWPGWSRTALIWDSLSGDALRPAYLPRWASTSAGCTIWPVLLDQWFLV